LSNAIVDSTQTPHAPQEHNAPPQAMLIFVIGEHRFEDSCELGVLNEHPEALETITSKQCLSTSAFLYPALHVVMAELRPSMMVQVAVRLTAITSRLVAEILPTDHATRQDEGVRGDDQQAVRHDPPQTRTGSPVLSMARTKELPWSGAVFDVIAGRDYSGLGSDR